MTVQPASRLALAEGGDEARSGLDAAGDLVALARSARVAVDDLPGLGASPTGWAALAVGLRGVGTLIALRQLQSRQRQSLILGICDRVRGRPRAGWADFVLATRTIRSRPMWRSARQTWTINMSGSALGADLLHAVPRGVPWRRWRPCCGWACAAGARRRGTTLDTPARWSPDKAPETVRCARRQHPQGRGLPFSARCSRLWRIVHARRLGPGPLPPRPRGAERQQFKWFAYVGILTITCLFVAICSSFSSVCWSRGRSGVFFFDDGPWSLWLSRPGAVSRSGSRPRPVAILRHRLYDVAVVINRTLVYGSLTAALGAHLLGSCCSFLLASRGVGARRRRPPRSPSPPSPSVPHGPASRRCRPSLLSPPVRRDVGRVEAFGAHLRDGSPRGAEHDLRGVVAGDRPARPTYRCG